MGHAKSELERKEQELRETLRACGSAIIGYSGGVDSAYLAMVALDALGADGVLAVTGRSPAYPAVQQEMAVKVAESIGLPHLEIETYELEDPNYAANPKDRCYFCKAELYGRLVALAEERGFAVVLDGSNADDLDDHRPGLIAARELGVRSPLQEVGLTKEEIRSLSRRAGLPTWEIPASPCLASRIRYGIQVTPRRLSQIEVAESRIRGLHPWHDLRVRHHGDLARLEIAGDGLGVLASRSLRDETVRALREAGFERACLDLEGYRRGALNEAHSAGDSPSASGDGTGSAEAERRLAATGIRVTVEAAGSEGEVAVIRPGHDSFAPLLAELRTVVIDGCRAAGFRFVTVELQ
jgi:uncharacterized protein